MALPGLSKDRRRRAFVTTLTELIAIAAASRTGLRSTPKNGKSAPAATGMRATLYAKAQKRPCLILPTVRRESAMPVTMLRRSPRRA